ncbi:hypothetical protein F4X88_11945 [Candidatus Poribacteria bacterium]|nr:hypothetical protein [Candidatus Poribacteria bacterium]
MYNLEFREVEGIDQPVAFQTNEFRTAWEDDDDAVRRNGYTLTFQYNNRPWVIRIPRTQDPLIGI